jgi:hypothetical protein
MRQRTVLCVAHLFQVICDMRMFTEIIGYDFDTGLMIMKYCC